MRIIGAIKRIIGRMKRIIGKTFKNKRISRKKKRIIHQGLVRVDRWERGAQIMFLVYVF